MNKKAIIIGLILAVALGGGLYYRSTQIKSGGAEHAEQKKPATRKKRQANMMNTRKRRKAMKGTTSMAKRASVKMTAEVQKQNGVVVAPAKKQRLAGDDQRHRQGGGQCRPDRPCIAAHHRQDR